MEKDSQAASKTANSISVPLTIDIMVSAGISSGTAPVLVGVQQSNLRSSDTSEEQQRLAPIHSSTVWQK